MDSEHILGNSWFVPRVKTSRTMSGSCEQEYSGGAGGSPKDPVPSRLARVTRSMGLCLWVSGVQVLGLVCWERHRLTSQKTLLQSVLTYSSEWVP